jgi:hypothetical protein
MHARHEAEATLGVLVSDLRLMVFDVALDRLRKESVQ